jgi:hypothetical protein
MKRTNKNLHNPCSQPKCKLRFIFHWVDQSHICGHHQIENKILYKQYSGLFLCLVNVTVMLASLFRKIVCKGNLDMVWGTCHKSGTKGSGTLIKNMKERQ